MTDGSKYLLGGGDVNQIDNFDDINNYINLADEVGSSKGNTKRYSYVKRRREELSKTGRE